MPLSPEAKSLLVALRRGETVHWNAIERWQTSGGETVLGSAVYGLVRAGMAEYFEWSESPRIGTAARLKEGA